MKKFIENQSLKFSALVVLGMMAGAEDAMANGQAQFNDVATNITEGIEEIPGFVTGIAYMLGILLAVLGILKIKDHVENPGQTPLQHGVIRLAAGGGLFAVPIIMESMDNLVEGTAEAGGTVDPAALKKVKMGTTN